MIRLPAGPSPAGVRLRSAMCVTALVVAASGILHVSGVLASWFGPGFRAAPGHLPAWVILPAVTLVAALGALLQIRVRTQRGEVGFSWGETAIVAACFVAPPGYLPVGFLAGVLLAQLIQVRTGRCASVAKAISNSASISLSAASAAAVVLAAGLRPHQLLDVGNAAALAGAGATFCVVSLMLVTGLVATTTPTQPYWPLLRTMARNKVPMAIGNTVVAIAGLAAVATSHWWILALPPALWLLHQTYAYRLRSESERRSWEVFADATRELNHLDERRAAAAGLDGVRRLFGTRVAEIVIDGPPGDPRAYLLGADDAVSRTEPPVMCTDQPIAARPLLVGGARIGELRLLRGPALNRRDSFILSAYGDALAASLHDAATNTELRSLTERSTYDAEHDGLTGLANRGSLLVKGAALLHQLDPMAPVALLLLDINHFKEVNTTLGHAAGDELLRITAHRLAARTVPGEVLARLGGDEFALMLSGATAQLSYALDRARQLAEELAVPTEVAGVQLSVEASIGVVAAYAGDVDITELLRRADIAMYQAKRDGSSVAWYDPGRDDASTDRLALLAELREALTGRDQVHLLLQPAVALDTGRPLSVEAFVRWQHPRRGTLKPVHFVRAVEQSELLGLFTRHVLELALAVAGQLGALGVQLPVAVNLSPRSLHDRQLPGDLARLLERFNVPAERLVLEITETVVLSKQKVVDDVLAALRALGVQLAVDDFGTGCSALTFLTRVPVNEVKIDRTFVTRMVDSPQAAAIVRTTVELGRELGLRVVAEGVETADQRRALLALGCQAAQGFHFYAPMPVDRMVEVLRRAAADEPVAAPVPIRRLRAAE